MSRPTCIDQALGRSGLLLLVWESNLAGLPGDSLLPHGWPHVFLLKLMFVFNDWALGAQLITRHYFGNKFQT